jgi:molybdenum cofactor guanylyltransferase
MTFSAVLLVGGESRRMGKDKATIVFEDRPLWERQLRTLRDLNPEEIFISARNSPAWLPPDAKLLLDEPPSRGPLSGLTKSLSSIRTSHLIILAVDMPFMTSNQMKRLSELAKRACGVLPMIGDRAEPLAAIYPREVAPDFSTALSGKDFSLQRLSKNLVQERKLQVFQVSPIDAKLYRSVNTPGDVKQSQGETV